MADSYSDITNEDQHLLIGENGNIVELDYVGLKSFHKGDAWWGCAVGFRALQLAATVFSKQKLWDRNHLSVISMHPGPGVRDAFEYVTHVVSSNRYHVDLENRTSGCIRDMKYEWTVTSAGTSICITLRENFVPQSFFKLIDRIGTAHERETDQENFNQLKTDLCTNIWREPLNKAFKLEHL